MKYEHQIDSLLAEYNQLNQPGFSVGVFQNNEWVYTRGLGLANLDYKVPNSKDTVFRIASTSKQFTAACIFLLERQGKLSLQDRLSNFFPEFPEYAQRIRVHHLLHHTSGLRDYLMLAYLAGKRKEDYYTDFEVMEWLVRQQNLNFEPGSAYAYSNSGYWLLGQIVRKVSGKTLAEFAQEYVFAPLEMTHTHFHDDPTRIVENRATGYTVDEKENFKISMTPLPMVGDGGVFTTITDFKKWIDEYALCTYFDREFWEKMTSVGMLENGQKTNYAGGLEISTYQGLKTVSHGGSFVGYLSHFVLFPKEELALVCFANRNDILPWAINFMLADVFLDGNVNAQAPEKQSGSQKFLPLSSEELSSFAGEYVIQPGIECLIEVDQSGLTVMQNWNESQYIIRPIATNVFVLPEQAEIRFEFSDFREGKASKLTVFQQGKKTECERKQATDFSGLNLEDYVGVYSTKELDVRYNMLIGDKALLCKVGNQECWELIPQADDRFVTQEMQFIFCRKEGLVSSFILEVAGIKNLEFIKE
ncbi:serine hydrolase domain-containing protein [Rapidithrix thailandica]|uniref:Serine hydrolase domain-containing protein n=1 Tax=Rapidithrix thailandica TaxID=413964 RepID=A0AAW9S4H8_9BACT